jgi:hypothetical protein
MTTHTLCWLWWRRIHTYHNDLFSPCEAFAWSQTLLLVKCILVLSLVLLVTCIGVLSLVLCLDPLSFPSLFTWNPGQFNPHLSFCIISYCLAVFATPSWEPTQWKSLTLLVFLSKKNRLLVLTRGFKIKQKTLSTQYLRPWKNKEGKQCMMIFVSSRNSSRNTSAENTMKIKRQQGCRS